MTIWYLWAANPAANNAFVQIVGESNMEHLRQGVSCADGEKRDLFQCPGGYADVRKAVAAKRDFNLKFEVFQQVGDDKPARYDLWKKSARKKAKAQARSALMFRQRSK